MSETCACGRVPDQTTPASFWDKMMVLTRYDGTHAAGQCEISQLVTPERPEQDELLRRIAAALAECERIDGDGDYHHDALIAVDRVRSILRGES